MTLRTASMVFLPMRRAPLMNVSLLTAEVFGVKIRL